MIILQILIKFRNLPFSYAQGMPSGGLIYILKSSEQYFWPWEAVRWGKNVTQYCLLWMGVANTMTKINGVLFQGGPLLDFIVNKINIMFQHRTWIGAVKIRGTL